MHLLGEKQLSERTLLLNYFMNHNLCKLLIFCFLFFIHGTCFCSHSELIIEPEQGTYPLLHAVDTARRSVNLVMYGFTDLEFVSALSQAKNKGKTIQVLLQHYPYKATDENTAAIEALLKSNVLLKWPSDHFQLTHQKTFLMDDGTAIVMTFNLTHSSFKNERNFALIIHDADDVKEIQNVFNADWQHKQTEVHQENLIWSPENSREKILSLIQHAQSDIRIYAESLTDYEVIGALARAARKGVKVTLLTSVNTEKSSNKKFAFLQRAGVQIVVSQHYYIHAKALIIDNQIAMLGSINFTRESLDKNRELSVVTHDPVIIKQLQQTYDLDSHSNVLAPSVNFKKLSLPLLIVQGIKDLARFHKSDSQEHRHYRRHHRLRKKKLYV